eukprot:1759070-Rhodomonas_salina.2
MSVYTAKSNSVCLRKLSVYSTRYVCLHYEIQPCLSTLRSQLVSVYASEVCLSTPRNQMHHAAFPTQIERKKRFLVFDFGVYCLFGTRARVSAYAAATGCPVRTWGMVLVVPVRTWGMVRVVPVLSWGYNATSASTVMGYDAHCPRTDM